MLKMKSYNIILMASVGTAVACCTFLVVFSRTVEQSVTTEDISKNVVKSPTYKQWLENVETEKPVIKSKSKEKFHLITFHDSKHSKKQHQAKARMQLLASKTVPFASGYPIGRHIRGFLDVAAELDPSDDSTVPAVVIPNQKLAQSSAESQPTLSNVQYDTQVAGFLHSA